MKILNVLESWVGSQICRSGLGSDLWAHYSSLVHLLAPWTAVGSYRPDEAD